MNRVDEQRNEVKMQRNPLVKGLFIIGGLVSVGLGVVGIFLPLLPTTPFLLLAAFLFIRSSDRLYVKLMEHPVLGTYIKNYVEEKGLPQKTKVIVLTLLWISIIVSMVLSGQLWVQFLLGCIAVVVTIHVSRLKTIG